MLIFGLILMVFNGMANTASNRDIIVLNGSNNVVDAGGFVGVKEILCNDFWKNKQRPKNLNRRRDKRYNVFAVPQIIQAYKKLCWRKD